MIAYALGLIAVLGCIAYAVVDGMPTRDEKDDL